MNSDDLLPEGWCRHPFQEVIDFQEGPGIMARDFRPSGVPLIRLAGLERGNDLLAGCNFLDPEMVDRKWSHFGVAEGDTLLSTSATLGRTAVVTADAVGAVPYTGIIRMRPRDGRIRSEFIPFLLQSPDFQQQVEMMGVGSVMRHFGPSHLRQMSVVVPPLPEQRAIAHILGTLDDKIELNRRMNETLEAIARALFKSWFVDFDPVRAKAEGRQPTGMDAATAALFPDSFEDSPLGEIPKGWTVASLDEIATFLNGLAMQKFPATGPDYLPVIKIAELRSGITASSGRVSTDLDSRYIIDDGDVLFSWSGSLEVVLWCGGRGALNQHLFKVTSEQYPRWFFFWWLRHHLTYFRSIAADKATTMGHIQRRHLTEALAVVPSSDVLDRAGDLIAPLMDRVITNNLESRMLDETRDALLPKLLSGEVLVKDAERSLAEVAT